MLDGFPEALDAEREPVVIGSEAPAHEAFAFGPEGTET
jgi:hypothetical protein